MSQPLSDCASKPLSSSARVEQVPALAGSAFQGGPKYKGNTNIYNSLSGIELDSAVDLLPESELNPKADLRANGPTEASAPTFSGLNSGLSLKPDSSSNPKADSELNAETALELCQLLYQNILEFLPGFKTPNFNAWSYEMHRLLREDKREPEEVKLVLDFVRGDPFWQSNVLNPKDLRRHYDKLNAKRLIPAVPAAKPKPAEEKGALYAWY
jgi:hypothetical protein